MVYGAIGLNYKSKLVVTNIKITSEVYTNNIEKSGMLEELVGREYVFMQKRLRSGFILVVITWLFGHQILFNSTKDQKNSRATSTKNLINHNFLIRNILTGQTFS